MKDYVNIGITPSGEDCIQVSKTENYLPAMRKQAERFKTLLEKAFPPKGNGYLSIKSFPHDFGSYLEVVANFDDADEEGQKWAYDLEGAVPETWAELEKLAGVEPTSVAEYEKAQERYRGLSQEQKDEEDVKAHRAVYVSRIPECDFCAKEGKHVPARYDAATNLGPWANMCDDHFMVYARYGLGLGKGQRLILRKDKDDKGAKPKLPGPPTIGDLKAKGLGAWKPPGGPIKFGRS
jgi:hypothetical protein